MFIEVESGGGFIQKRPEDVTDQELCEALSRIQLDSDEFIPQKEIDEGYAAIAEAIRRIERRKTEVMHEGR